MVKKKKVDKTIDEMLQSLYEKASKEFVRCPHCDKAFAGGDFTNMAKAMALILQHEKNILSKGVESGDDGIPEFFKDKEEESPNEAGKS